ncbi:hypothetical protein AVEN_260162-1 [Araneus ventricosus]|uniref:Uncharacterized protein n=1 Tax=Araneus ventricosus TaxID=182803 RepID=A0A4Y2DPX0_ARAVE|nr:hypothetical protein AVEN_260162-1 [Araneus ventricosus]
MTFRVENICCRKKKHLWMVLYVNQKSNGSKKRRGTTFGDYLTQRSPTSGTRTPGDDFQELVRWYAAERLIEANDCVRYHSNSEPTTCRGSKAAGLQQHCEGGRCHECGQLQESEWLFAVVVKSDKKQLHWSFSTNQSSVSGKRIAPRNLAGALILPAMFTCRQLSSNWPAGFSSS